MTFFNDFAGSISDGHPLRNNVDVSSRIASLFRRCISLVVIRASLFDKEEDAIGAGGRLGTSNDAPLLSTGNGWNESAATGWLVAEEDGWLVAEDDCWLVAMDEG